MRKATLFILAAAALVALCVAGAGCANITSAVTPMHNNTGEIWYVKDVGLHSSTVYYCPPPSTQRPVKCIEAEIVE